MSAPVEIRVEKHFRHPPERVFDAFLDPARVGDWLFHTPAGTMEQTDYDPSPGGTFAIFERRGADLARHFGRFVEIERPARIVFDFWVDEAPDEPTRVSVAFAPTEDGSVVVLTHDLAPAWAGYAGRTTEGWTLILDSLAKVTDAAPPAWLAEMVGEWTYDGRAVPDDPNRRQTGTETVRSEGCWILIGSDDGARIRLAFDPDAGRVVGDFIQLNHPTMWAYEGAFEDGRLRLASRGPSYDVEGEIADYEDVFETLSPDRRRMTGRIKGKDGTWRDFTLTEYRRKT